MKWLSVEHEYHPLREWHPVPFAWRPIKINTVTYWLERPPYDRKLVKEGYGEHIPEPKYLSRKHTDDNPGYWYWILRPHPIPND